MDDSKKKLLGKLSESKNVLITVSKNPSVDQLAALMGLALALDKAKKHTAAVFSGKVPSTLEFLQPEDTIQNSTDSLRDFIISLDRAKAAKLRYTAEEDVVKIFITPYRSSITQDDLTYSQGEYNVDLVIALGVKQQSDLDDAIVSHGSILHDATVATINLSNEAGLGTINWNEENASSLCELVTELVQAVDESLIDGQIATSLLTGIVAETARFSNDKTSSHTMSASAALMTAGANQQLIATQLEQGEQPLAGEESADSTETAVASDGTLEIDHTNDPQVDLQTGAPVEAPTPETPVLDVPVPEAPEASSQLSPGARLIVEPPTMGGQLTANAITEALEPSTDPLSAATPTANIIPKSDSSTSSPTGKTLSDIEKEVNSPHVQASKTLSDLEKEVNSPHVQASKTLSDLEKEVNSPHLTEASTLNNQPDQDVMIGAQPADTIASDIPSNENQAFNASAAPPVPPPLPFDQKPPEQQ